MNQERKSKVNAIKMKNAFRDVKKVERRDMMIESLRQGRNGYGLQTANQSVGQWTTVVAERKLA